VLEPDETVAQPTTPEVVKTLVDNHRRFLAFLERRVGSREVAEDILQDAFVRGLAGAARLRDEDSVVAWFYRTLRQCTHRPLAAPRRRAARHRSRGEHGRDVRSRCRRRAARRRVRLRERDAGNAQARVRRAVRRVDMDEMSVKAFAEHAGITPNNASVRLFRGREALREQLRRSCGTCATHGCLDCTCGGPDRRAG
jgi:RNA polymerase sigma-70 factor (ECF subfamily)